MKRFAIISLLLILVFDTGCHVKKRILNSKAGYHTFNNVMEDYRIQHESIERIWIKKYSGELHFNGNLQKIKGNIRIVKDSLIILSMGSGIGIEAVRIYLKPDSVTILNRLGNTYYSEPVFKAKQELDVMMDYRIIEDILLLDMAGLTGGLEPGKRQMMKDSTKDLYCYDQLNIPVYKNETGEKLNLSKTCIRRRDGSIAELKYGGPGENRITKLTLDITREESDWMLLNKLGFEIYYREDKEVWMWVEFTKMNVNTNFPTKFNLGSKYSRVSRIRLL